MMSKSFTLTLSALYSSAASLPTQLSEFKKIVQFEDFRTFGHVIKIKLEDVMTGEKIKIKLENNQISPCKQELFLITKLPDFNSRKRLASPKRHDHTKARFILAKSESERIPLKLSQFNLQGIHLWGNAWKDEKHTCKPQCRSERSGPAPCLDPGIPCHPNRRSSGHHMRVDMQEGNVNICPDLVRMNAKSEEIARFHFERVVQRRVRRWRYLRDTLDIKRGTYKWCTFFHMKCLQFWDLTLPATVTS